MKADRTILIAAKDLSIGYDLPLIKNINLNLFAGELVCFMGPNGVGKSSLLRVLAGLQRPLSGSLTYPVAIPREKSVAVVLTDNVRAQMLTVRELVGFGRYPYLNWHLSHSDPDAQMVSACLDKLGITHLQHRRISELSDGQFQMAMIARALAQDTPILLLDEPTSHLDLNNRLEIMTLLRSTARKEGKAILVTTHELDLALQTADTVWLAGDDGSILSGVPEDLVLNESFDKVFQFKGYNLKTGRIQHLAFRELPVGVEGTGHPMLWTKNALERSGYQVVDYNDSAARVRIVETEENLRWELVLDDKRFALESVSELLDRLSVWQSQFDKA